MIGHDHTNDGGTAYYFNESGIQFTEEGRRHFTEEERNRLTDLHQQRGVKIDEICDHMTRPFGPKGSLSKEQVNAIAAEAEELTERWEEAEVEDDPEQIRKAITSDPELQALLAAHHEVGQAILEIQHEALSRQSGTA